MAFTKITGPGIHTLSNIMTNNVKSSGIITAVNGNLTGWLAVGSTASFGGNVSIGGTLTYDDVTYVESVGIVTAKGGLHVGAGGSIIHALSEDDGAVGVNNLTPSSQYYKNLVVGSNNAGSWGITVRTNSANSGNLAFSDTDSANAGRYDGRISYEHTDQSMRFHTNAAAGGTTEKLRITSAGNVGINSTSPTTRLDVFKDYNGVGAGNPAARIYGTDFGIAETGIRFVEKGTGDLHNASDAYLMRGISNGATRFVFSGNGKVGIGTITPQTILHLHDSASTRIQFTDTAMGAASGDGVIVGLNGDDDFFINNRESGKGIKFFTGSDDLRLHINSSGISTFNAGNVNGISFPLSVKNDNNDNDYDMGTGIKLHGGSSTEFYKWSGIVARGDNNGEGGYSNTQALAFYTYNQSISTAGGTEKMRLTSGGLLGIGTASPNSIIHGYGSYSGTGYYFRNTHTTSGFGVRIEGGGTTADRYSLAVFNAAGEEAFRVNANKRVGIGTMIPDMTLHVRSDSDDVARFQSTNASNGTAITLDHIGGSAADGDIVGKIVFNGQDDAYNSTTYADIRCISSDVSNGSETAHLDFGTRALNAFNPILRLAARSTASAPSYTTDDMNGIILDTYNAGGGSGYERFFSFIAKSSGDTNSNIAFWTEKVGGSPIERLRITKDGELVMSNSSTITFIDLETTNNNTRAVISMKGKTSSGGDVTLKMGGFGDTTRGEIFTHSNHALGFATNNAAAQMILTTQGHLQLVGGNLEFANGNGIDFSNVPQAGSGSPTTDGNKLDDYEEGEFTPTLKNFTGSYTSQIGRYTKVGNIVHYNVFVKINSASGSGVTGINLPFDNASGMTVVGHLVGNEHWDTNLSGTNITTWMPNGSNEARFYKNSGLNLSQINVSDIGNSGEIAIAGSYRV